MQAIHYILYFKLINIPEAGFAIKRVCNLGLNVCIDLITGTHAENQSFLKIPDLNDWLGYYKYTDFESSLSGKYEGLPTFKDMSTILSSDKIEYFINITPCITPMILLSLQNHLSKCS